jgi:SAM-dependent methyltransferase
MQITIDKNYLEENITSREAEIFTKIYDENFWGGGSGKGSDPKNAGPYLELLQSYLDDPKINSIIDLGCGDWRLMETLKIPDNKLYIGFDLVKSVIDTNIKNHSKSNIRFTLIRDLSDFRNQTGDLLIVKDVIHHWETKTIQFFIQTILPNFKYTLITNGYNAENNNYEIETGKFRPIDLEAEPFNMLTLKVVLDYPAHGAVKRVYLHVG